MGAYADAAKGRPSSRPDGFCTECRDRPGEHFTVIRVVGAVGVPAGHVLWRPSYSADGKLCKPCAITIAQVKTARGDRA